jgi:hypothetical protein
MPQFEYLIPFVGIIYGLGATDLLVSIHRLIIERRTITFHILPISWAAVSFVLIINGWWGFFDINKSIKLEHAGHLFLLSTLPLSLFLTTAMSLPHKVDGYLNLLDYFNEHKKPFYLSLCIYLLLIPIVLNIISEVPQWQNIASHSIVCSLLIVLIWVKHWGWHLLFVILFFANTMSSIFKQSIV